MTVLFNILAIALTFFGAMGVGHSIIAIFKQPDSAGYALTPIAVCLIMILMGGMILIMGAPA